MKFRILVVDDDYGTLKLLDLILTNNGYEFSGFTSPHDAMKSFFSNHFDAVISAFYMPEMNGAQFLAEIRIKDKFIPFLILTSGHDINVAVDLMKKGADDYIAKPVNKEDILFRVSKTIKENKNKRLIDQIEKEKEIALLENKRLADWKMLYASKDIKQSENLIELFNRTLNEGGGFSWLELMKKDIKKSDDGKYSISSDLAELIIKTSERHQVFFNNIAYIASINSINLDVEKISYHKFVNVLTDYINSDLLKIVAKYNRTIYIQETSQFLQAEMIICVKYINKIMKELIINAIKYSPDNSPIYIMFDRNPDLTKGSYMDVVVKNTPRVMNSRLSDYDRQFIRNKDIDTQGFIEAHDDVVLFNQVDDIVMFGEDDALPDATDTTKYTTESYDQVVGIPYEYSELVFDLFYTIEPFPVEIEEEEWKGGTGLYIARKIINRHNGLIRNANGVDYSQGSPSPFVKFLITLPYRKTV